MKWVKIEGTHINTNQIATFYWKDGRLEAWFVGDAVAAKWDDPDRELYVKLCQQIGVEPEEAG